MKAADEDHDREARGASILLPCLLAAAIGLSGLLALDKFSVNWDAAVGDLFFGQRYFSYFTSFDGRYLDFDADPYPAGFTPDLSSAAFRDRPWEHYPVSSTLATMTGVALSKGAGVFDEFDGIQAFNPILGAVFAFILFRLVERWAGRGVAFFTVAFLFLSPRITYHFMVNIKDFPEMVFFSLALLLFFDGYERGKPLRLLASGVVLGLALGTKANALFAPIIAGLFLVARGVPGNWERRRVARLALILTAGLVALVVMVAAWPYLWTDTWNRLVENLSYIATRSVDSGSECSHPLAMLAYTSPPALIVAFAIGLIPLSGRLHRRDPLALLIVSWIAVVMARLLAPGAVNFDGVRHFLEIFPPLAISAALGIEWLAITIASRFPAPGKRRLIHASLAVLFLVPIATSVVRMHPFQVAYWNFLVGGPEGAYRRGLPQWGDYWATSYRIGLDWVNRNAPLDSVLVVPIAEHTVRIVEAERLRPDIRLAHVLNAGSPALVAGSFDSLKAMSVTQPVLVMFAPRTEWSNEIVTHCQQKLEPVASWGIGTVDYLVIYRFEDTGLRGSNSLPVRASTVPP